nr:AAA-like domain-containing protein [Nostoc sp. ChiSLP01]
MANRDHVKVLQEGWVDSWNDWRKKNKSLKPDLSGVSFYKQICGNLENADFSYTDLRNADISYVFLNNTDFRGANLQGANFEGCDLSKVIINRETQFEAKWLIVANIFHRPKQGQDLRNADLQKAYISNAQLLDADLRDADLRGADLRGTDLRGADLRGADLRGVVLHGTKIDSTTKLDCKWQKVWDILNASDCCFSLDKSDLREVMLQGARLEGISLIEADLSYACLRCANLKNANLENANLRNANLSGAEISGTKLKNTNFSKVDLQERKFTNTDLSGVNFSDANLSRIVFLNTNLKKAILTGACIEDWHINSSTDFTDITCEYIYLQQKQNERRPSSGNFAPGEFTKLFQKSLEIESVNAGRIGGDIYDIHFGQQMAASNNPPQSQSQRQRSQQEKDSLEKAYTLQSQKVASIRTAWVIETDPSRKFQYEQQLQLEERTLKELGDKLDAVERQLQADNNSGLDAGAEIYIERPPIEDKCNNAIVQPGALIRIKAPQRMGKTLLLEKILDHARAEGYQTAKLDLKLADAENLANLKTFLQWLCVDVADSLELEPQLDKHWQEVFGLNKNCTRYFQKYLLSVTDTPLVLAIDNFERLFDYPEIFPQFCLLLRGWYEAAKQGDKIGNIWKKLRLVVVHSTESYPSLDTNHSPFNVGLAIELPEFSLQQVVELANQSGLEMLEEKLLSQLMGMVGGHPYLVQSAIPYLKSQQITLEELLRLAPTEQGIFSDHLRQQLWHLQHNPQLEAGYKRVVMTDASVRLDTEVAFKLHSLGLVKLVSNDCVPSCDLYRQYFSTRLR